MGRRRLQNWYHIEIIDVKSSDGSVNRHVEFHSRIHKNMPVRLSFCFASKFSDQAILSDAQVITKFIEHFGADALGWYQISPTAAGIMQKLHYTSSSAANNTASHC